jgi:hypothetical protein
MRVLGGGECALWLRLVEAAQAEEGYLAGVCGLVLIGRQTWCVRSSWTRRVLQGQAWADCQWC